MTIRFLTPSGALDEQAWAEMCAGAAREAAEGCSGSDLTFRSRYSRAIVGALSTLPSDVRSRALGLANEHGDFATAEEMDGELAERAAAGLQGGIEFIEPVGDEIADLETAFQENERLHMLEGSAFNIPEAVIDAAHGGNMTRAMLIGVLKMWAKNGMRVQMYRFPEVRRNNRVVWLVVIRSTRRLFCCDYQLELTVSRDGAAYASNVLLQDDAGSELLPHTLPAHFNTWLMSVMKGFHQAATRNESMLIPPVLAYSPDWQQIDALFKTPRG